MYSMSSLVWTALIKWFKTFIIETESWCGSVLLSAAPLRSNISTTFCLYINLGYLLFMLLKLKQMWSPRSNMRAHTDRCVFFYLSLTRCTWRHPDTPNHYTGDQGWTGGAKGLIQHGVGQYAEHCSLELCLQQHPAGKEGKGWVSHTVWAAMWKTCTSEGKLHFNPNEHARCWAWSSV